MKTYKIVAGLNGKQNIEYYDGPNLETRELYSQPGFTAEIREGYTNQDAPNWNGLTQSLWGSQLMGYAYSVANPNGFSLLLKVLSDGEAGSAVESSFITAYTLCQLNLSTNQKQELNSYLTANNFTIQVT